jgi:hypothetical protein
LRFEKTGIPSPDFTPAIPISLRGGASQALKNSSSKEKREGMESMECLSKLEPYIVHVVTVVIVIGMILSFLRRKRAPEAWRAFALKHGFQYAPPGPPSLFSSRSAVAFRDPGEVRGTVHNLPFRLHVEIQGTGRNRNVFTLMSAEIPTLPAGMTICHENTFLKITKFFGAQDIRTSDPRFDAAFVVKGNDPASALLWLDSARRSAILSVLEKNPDMDIRGGCLRFQRSEIIDDSQELERALLDFEALAPHL